MAAPGHHRVLRNRSRVPRRAHRHPYALRRPTRRRGREQQHLRDPLRHRSRGPLPDEHRRPADGALPATAEATHVRLLRADARRHDGRLQRPLRGGLGVRREGDPARVADERLRRLRHLGPRVGARPRPARPPGLVREMLEFSWPTILSGIAFYALNFLDRFFVAHYHGTADTGLYGAAFRYGQVVVVGVSPSAWAGRSGTSPGFTPTGTRRWSPARPTTTSSRSASSSRSSRSGSFRSSTCSCPSASGRRPTQCRLSHLRPQEQAHSTSSPSA